MITQTETMAEAPKTRQRQAPPPVKLDAKEAKVLESCEEVIHNHLESFADAGTALISIRDQKLYRAEFLTFEDYCRTRWEFSKTQANRLIAAAKVSANVAAVGDVVPETESQTRLLSVLDPKTQRKVWKKVVETVGGESGRITAKLVSQVAHATAPAVFKRMKKAKTGNGGRKSGDEVGDLVRRSAIVSEFEVWAKNNHKLIAVSSGAEVVKLVRGFLATAEI